jgi:hypothetical protein
MFSYFCSERAKTQQILQISRQFIKYISDCHETQFALVKISGKKYFENIPKINQMHIKQTNDVSFQIFCHSFQEFFLTYNSCFSDFLTLTLKRV